MNSQPGTPSMQNANKKQHKWKLQNQDKRFAKAITKYKNKFNFWKKQQQKKLKSLGEVYNHKQMK